MSITDADVSKLTEKAEENKISTPPQDIPTNSEQNKEDSSDSTLFGSGIDTAPVDFNVSRSIFVPNNPPPIPEMPKHLLNPQPKLDEKNTGKEDEIDIFAAFSAEMNNINQPSSSLLANKVEPETKQENNNTNQSFIKPSSESESDSDNEEKTELVEEEEEDKDALAVVLRETIAQNNILGPYHHHALIQRISPEDKARLSPKNKNAYFEIRFDKGMNAKMARQLMNDGLAPYGWKVVEQQQLPFIKPAAPKGVFDVLKSRISSDTPTAPSFYLQHKDFRPLEQFDAKVIEGKIHSRLLNKPMIRNQFPNLDQHISVRASSEMYNEYNLEITGDLWETTIDGWKVSAIIAQAFPELSLDAQHVVGNKHSDSFYKVTFEPVASYIHRARAAKAQEKAQAELQSEINDDSFFGHDRDANPAPLLQTESLKFLQPSFFSSQLGSGLLEEEEKKENENKLQEMPVVEIEPFKPKISFIERAKSTLFQPAPPKSVVKNKLEIIKDIIYNNRVKLKLQKELPAVVDDKGQPMKAYQDVERARLFTGNEKMDTRQTNDGTKVYYKLSNNIKTNVEGRTEALQALAQEHGFTAGVAKDNTYYFRDDKPFKDYDYVAPDAAQQIQPL